MYREALPIYYTSTQERVLDQKFLSELYKNQSVE
jgi:hypothetical protein